MSAEAGTSATMQQPVIHEKSSLIENIATKQSRRLACRKFVRRRLPILAGALIVLSMIAGIVVVFLTSFRKVSLHKREAEESLYELNKLKTKHTLAGCECTIVLMRHCEKQGPHVWDNGGNEHCSYLGLERASYLSKLFGDNSANETIVRRWPSPSHLYGLSPHRPGLDHMNFRMIETLTPLAQQVNIEIDSQFTIGQEIDLAYHFFQKLIRGTYCGRVVVVSWKHSRIAKMAVALGCGPNQGCRDRWRDVTNFDEIWEIKYVFEPQKLYDEEHEVETFGVRRVKRSKGTWIAYGYTSALGFDPLQYSMNLRDYPPNGAPTGGRWNGH